jgi:hypothetical protein
LESARQQPSARILPAQRDLAARAPSGTGVQLSLFGLAAGVLVGLEEGLEVNVLGLLLGLDLNRPRSASRRGAPRFP